ESRTGERKAVRVQTRRGNPDQHVAARGAVAGDHPRTLDDADDGPGDIEVAVVVHRRHLCGLTADQRAVVQPARLRTAGHHLGGQRRIELPGRKVVEKIDRTRAADGDVVDAVVDDIPADTV